MLVMVWMPWIVALMGARAIGWAKGPIGGQRNQPRPYSSNWSYRVASLGLVPIWLPAIPKGFLCRQPETALWVPKQIPVDFQNKHHRTGRLSKPIQACFQTVPPLQHRYRAPIPQNGCGRFPKKNPTDTPLDTPIKAARNPFSLGTTPLSKPLQRPAKPDLYPCEGIRVLTQIRLTPRPTPLDTPLIPGLDPFFGHSIPRPQLPKTYAIADLYPLKPSKADIAPDIQAG